VDAGIADKLRRLCNADCYGPGMTNLLRIDDARAYRRQENGPSRAFLSSPFVFSIVMAMLDDHHSVGVVAMPAFMRPRSPCSRNSARAP